MNRNASSISVLPVFALTLSALAGGCVGPSVPLGGLDGGDEAATSGDGEGADSAGNSMSTAGGDTGDDSGGPTCVVEIGGSDGRALDPVRWHNTIVDLFGVEAQLAFPPGYLRGITYPAVPADPQLEPVYAEGAAQVAALVDIASLLACDVETTGAQADACIGELATALGRLAHRRPMDPADVASLVALQPGEVAGVRGRAVVQELLSQSAFWELDESGSEDPRDPGTIVLGEHAIATRLAYFVWNSTPDHALLDRADAGELSDPAIRASEVSRMLADSRAARAIGDYWEAVLGIDQLESHTRPFSAWNETVAGALREEVRRFVADVVLTEGDWATLLSATRSFQNAGLAAVYGGDIVGQQPMSPGHQLVELDPDRRPGLLTRAGVMARWSADAHLGFTHRGLFVVERLYCMTIPPPPPDIDPIDIGELAGLTRMEGVEHRLSDPICAGCHTMTDKTTLGFDNYDPMGRWQTELTVDGAPAGGEGALLPVDTQGELWRPSESSSTPFADRDELLGLLATSPDVQACLVENHLGFALGRAIVDADACTLEQLAAAFDASGSDLRQLVDDIVAADAFVRARP